MNDILCDKWNKKLCYLRNLNTKQTKSTHTHTHTHTNKFYTCIKNMKKNYEL